MKKTFIIYTLVLSSFLNVFGQRNKLDQLFDKYQEVEGVTSIKISKPMFGMLNNLNIADSELEQIKPLLKKINGLKVLITENPEGSSSLNIKKLNKEISTYVKNLNYSEVMSVKNGLNKIKFLSSEAKKDGTLENVLLNIDNGQGENILVMLDGEISMDDMNKIIDSGETSTINTRSKLTNRYGLESESSYLNGENRNVGSFNGVQLSSGVNVVFKQANATSVEVFADSDKLKNVITKVEGEILKIYIDNLGAKKLRFKTLSINVSSPNIRLVKASSGSIFKVVNSIKEKDIEVEASSGANISGEFEISDSAKITSSSGSVFKAKINSDKISLAASSGSSVNVEGTANSAIIDVSSGSACKATNFKVNTADVESTSGSSVSIDVTTNLKARSSSGATIRYKGNPTIESSISKISGGSLTPIKQ